MAEKPIEPQGSAAESILATKLHTDALPQEEVVFNQMKVFAISNRGLIVIACLVAVLWGLIFAERSLTLRAQRDYIEVMRSQPTSAPVKSNRAPGTARVPSAANPAQV